VLLERGLLNDALFVGAPATYGITRKGRAYLVENELID